MLKVKDKPEKVADRMLKVKDSPTKSRENQLKNGSPSPVQFA